MGGAYHRRVERSLRFQLWGATKVQGQHNSTRRHWQPFNGDTWAFSTAILRQAEQYLAPQDIRGDKHVVRVAMKLL